MRHQLFSIQGVACILAISVAVGAGRVSAQETNSTPFVVVNTSAEPVAAGKFAPTWASLKQYEVPEWFRDAKFGIWAHWGPQCQPEAGDWYAQNHPRSAESANPWNIHSQWHWGNGAKLLDGSIRSIQLPGSKEKINWQQTTGALTISQPRNLPNSFAIVLTILLKQS